MNPNFSRLRITVFLLCLSAPLLLMLFSTEAKAQSHLDSLRNEYNRQTDDSLKVLSGIALSRETHRNPHAEKADYSLAQEALQLALKSGDSLLYARALDNLGLLYRYHQRYAESLPLHIKAFELVENHEVPPRFKMIFANNAGVSARYNQAYDAAVDYYMRALKIAEREGDMRNIAISTNGIGNSLGFLSGREEEALGYFQRSLEAEQARGNSLGIAMNYLSIADYYIEKKEFDTARDYLNRLLKINREREDAYGLAITHEFFGKAFLEEGRQMGRAAEFFRRSLEQFQELDDRHKQAEILLSLGDIEMWQDSLEQAARFYEQSLGLAEELKHHGLLMQNSLNLASLRERQGRTSEALEYLKEGKAYEDSIKLSEQNVQVAALIRQYDLEKKENQIQLLEKDRALQQTLLENQKQKLERRRILVLLLILALCLILAVFLLQYRNYRTKRKTTARIQQEEKEKMQAIYERNLARAEILVTRLQVNPHFLFNSLNAITYLIQSEQNAKAMKYLVVFSRYTRMVLETSQKHVVPLKEELKLTRYYLTLEENRFEKDFTYEIKGDEFPEVEHALIPPLLLQPFIENAIWHGLLPSKQEKKQLFLEVIPEGDKIQILIDDNGVGRKQKASGTGTSHKSMGMKIIQERIELYNRSYSGKIEYEVIDKKDAFGQPEGTRIMLQLDQVKISKEPVKRVS